ncbi:nuclease-related domain-containing protein [Thermodesulfobacteriota bacterium B35]
MKQSKKSPLKDKPLRYSGQSLDERIDKLINEDALPYVFVCILVIYWSGYEWWRYFKNPPPNPIIATIFAVMVILFSIYKIKKILNKVKRLKLGRDGERAVGQFLDELRGKGHRIFHDIVGDSFNIDHIIISKKGIYVIETKTYSKPIGVNAKIYFDGKILDVEGLGELTNPVVQVNAASNWIKNILQETTGKKFYVKPVILFPGWFVESIKEGKKSNIWVLNPKALPVYIENQSDIISQEDLMLASYHISRYIRTTEVSV